MTDDATAGALRRPAFLAACALVLVLPNRVILGYPGGATLYLAEALIWVVFLPIFAATVTTGRRDPVSAGLERAPAAFAYVGLAAFAALLSLGIDGASAAPGKVKNLLAPLLLLCLILFVERGERDIWRLAVCVLLGSAMNAALGLAQIATGGPVVVPPHENNVWKEALTGGLLPNTAHGLFETPNALGAALAPSVVLGARMAVAGKSWLGAFALLAVSILIGAGLVASAHRGALIWAALGCAVAFWPSRRKRAIAIAATVAGAVGLAAVGVAAMGGLEGFGTLATRVELWLGAAEFFLHNPLVVAVGDGDAAFALQAARSADWALPMTHNAWLDQILFFGTAGFLAYVVMWAVAARAADRACLAARGREAALADGLIGALVALAGILVLEPRADGVYSVGQVLVVIALVTALADPAPSPVARQAALRSA